MTERSLQTRLAHDKINNRIANLDLKGLAEWLDNFSFSEREQIKEDLANISAKYLFEYADFVHRIVTAHPEAAENLSKFTTLAIEAIWYCDRVSVHQVVSIRGLLDLIFSYRFVERDGEDFDDSIYLRNRLSVDDMAILVLAKYGHVEEAWTLAADGWRKISHLGDEFLGWKRKFLLHLAQIGFVRNDFGGIELMPEMREIALQNLGYFSRSKTHLKKWEKHSKK